MRHTTASDNRPTPGESPVGCVTSERLLVERARHDRALFAEVYRLYSPRVSRYLRKRTGNSHDTEDLVSEVFLAAFRGLDRYRDRGVPFSRWLSRIAVHTAHAWTRRQRRHASPTEAVEEPWSDPLQSHQDQEEQQRALQAVALLPKEYREVVALHYLQGRPVEDIARILRCPPGTVKSRLSRGRAKLRRALAITLLVLAVALLGGGVLAATGYFFGWWERWTVPSGDTGNFKTHDSLIDHGQVDVETAEWRPELVALEKLATFLESIGESPSASFAGVDLDELRERIEEARGIDDLGARLEGLAEVALMLDGGSWTPLERLTASLGVRADRQLLDSPGVVTLRLESLFECEGEGDEWVLRVCLDRSTEISEFARRFGRVHVDDSPTVLLEQSAWSLADLDAELSVPLPEDIPADFFLTVTLIDDEGNERRVGSAPHFAVRPRMVEEVAALRERVAALRAQSIPANLQPSLDLAHYPVDLVESIDRGRIRLNETDLAREIKDARELLTELEAGVDPQPTPGLVRRVHRLAATGEVLPYMLFVPESYDPAQPTPLVVALHGLGAREDSYFRFGDGLICREAEDHGYLVVAPLGHRVDGWYANVSELDVLAVIELVRARYNVDPERMFLTGHSMGGFGCFALAARHPDLFAAIAPIAGGGDPETIEEFAHVPMFIAHGDADRVVPVSMSQGMVEAARAAQAEVEYVEIAGGDHFAIVADTLSRVFEFFGAR